MQHKLSALNKIAKLFVRRNQIPMPDREQEMLETGSRSPENRGSLRERDPRIYQFLSLARRAESVLDWEDVLNNAEKILGLDEQNRNGHVLKSTAELGLDINRLRQESSADPLSDWMSIRDQANKLLAADRRNQAGHGFRDIADLELKIFRISDEAGKAESQGKWEVVYDRANDILKIDHGNVDGLSLKARANKGRQIDRLLKEAEEAQSNLNWQAVRNLANNVLALDPSHKNGIDYETAATRVLGPPSQPTNWLTTLQRLLPIVPAFGVFAGLIVFLGRLYLNSYYSFFGIPPSSLIFEVQDYTFGGFPVFLFVLVVTACVLLYWRAVPSGWMGTVLLRLVQRWLRLLYKERDRREAFRRILGSQ